MVRQILSIAALTLFLGCATARAGEQNEEDQASSDPKKQERCIERMIIGSRIPRLICDGESIAFNTAEMSPQELRDRIIRSGGPTRN